MNIVEITGRAIDFNKVACISALCSVAKLDLADAQKVAEAVLEGKPQQVHCPSTNTADLLVKYLHMHGAIAYRVGLSQA